MARTPGSAPGLQGFGDLPTAVILSPCTAFLIRTESHRVTVGVLIAIEHRQRKWSRNPVSIRAGIRMKDASSPEVSGKPV